MVARSATPHAITADAAPRHVTLLERPQPTSRLEQCRAALDQRSSVKSQSLLKPCHATSAERALSRC